MYFVLYKESRITAQKSVTLVHSDSTPMLCDLENIGLFFKRPINGVVLKEHVAQETLASSTGCFHLIPQSCHHLLHE